MKYTEYQRHYAHLACLGAREYHLDYTVVSPHGSLTSPDEISNTLEETIVRYQEELSPGIFYRREKRTFHVDMIAYNTENQIDNLERAYLEIFKLPLTSGMIAPLYNQLPPQAS